MKQSEINAAAVKVFEACSTCKAAAAEYGKLSEMYGKENAAAIIKAAKGLINADKAENRNERNGVKNWFSDFNKIGLPIFAAYCKDDKKAGKVAAAFNNDLTAFISAWYPCTDENGRPAKVVKGTAKLVRINAAAVRTILRACFDNIVLSRIGRDKHNTVTIENAAE